MKQIIASSLAKSGYYVQSVNFTTGRIYEPEYRDFYDYNGRTVFNDVEIEVQGKTKAKGGI